MTDGYTGYQHLLTRLAGIQQCCQHIIRRCRAVIKLGPGGLQSWAGDIIEILREAHQAVDAEMLDKLGQRYDEAAAFGVIHNRLRDWDSGNHPGYALGCWLREYKEQVFPFTRDFAVDWTTNVAERGAKAAKRHQAVSGYWHTLATLARRLPRRDACAATSSRPRASTSAKVPPVSFPRTPWPNPSSTPARN